MKRFELLSTNHKAIVTEYDAENADLMSYTTKVMFLVGGKLYRKADQPQSNTTARHMREFAQLYDFPSMTKSELKQLPIVAPTIAR